MTDKNRVRLVRVVLGVLMAVAGASTLAGCPANTQPPPLTPRAASVSVID
ncbi:hypothetical protein [Mycobacterium asiaticum]|nr:hypothetical protein [Mycobacterium asiaticum]